MEEKIPPAAAEPECRTSSIDQQKGEQNIPLQTPHSISLEIFGHFFPTPESPLSMRYPRSLIWAFRVALISLFLGIIYLQQVSNKSLDIEKRRNLICGSLLASVVFCINSWLSSYVLQQVDDLEGRISREEAVRVIQLHMSLFFIGENHWSTDEKGRLMHPLRVRYNDLDEISRGNISKATAAFASYLVDPKDQLMSYFSISDTLFHFIVRLLVGWMLTIFLFGDSGVFRMDLWGVAFTMLVPIYIFFMVDAGIIGMRHKWARVARDIRKKYILADTEKGGGDFQSSVDWWSEQLSKPPFKEIESVDWPKTVSKVWVHNKEV